MFGGLNGVALLVILALGEGRWWPLWRCTTYLTSDVFEKTCNIDRSTFGLLDCLTHDGQDGVLF